MKRIKVSNKSILVIYGHNNEICIDSRDIAKEFGRRHDNVMQTINNLLADGTISLLECKERKYMIRGREYPCYELNEAGFLTAMPADRSSSRTRLDDDASFRCLCALELREQVCAEHDRDSLVKQRIHEQRIEVAALNTLLADRLLFKGVVETFLRRPLCKRTNVVGPVCFRADAKLFQRLQSRGDRRSSIIGNVVIQIALVEILKQRRRPRMRADGEQPPPRNAGATESSA